MKGKSNGGGTQMLRPQAATKQKGKNKTQTNTKTEVNQEQKIPKKGGVKIGETQDDTKWRCKICKQLNENELDVCQTCD